MSFEIHQSFMVGYVRRINEATLKVTIGGVRIGEARYTRLAQINLKSRIITFSRFAIENVPERGRRYLVIHELSHVIEADHSKRFWQLVARHEPNYREIGRELDQAFHRNVRSERIRQAGLKLGRGSNLAVPNLLAPAAAAILKGQTTPSYDEIDQSGALSLDADEDAPGGGCFHGSDDESGAWDAIHQGIVCGGDDLEIC